MHWWSIRLLCGGILVDTGGSQGGRPINLGPVYANSLQSDFLKWWGLEEEFYFLEFQRTSGNKSLDVVSKFGTESQDWILFLSRDIWRKYLLSFWDFVKHRTHSFWRLLLVFRQHQSIFLGIPRICWSASNFTLLCRPWKIHFGIIWKLLFIAFRKYIPSHGLGQSENVQRHRHNGNLKVLATKQAMYQRTDWDRF